VISNHPQRPLPHGRVDLARHAHILLDSERCGIKPVTVHIGIGRTHARTHVLLLIQDLHIRVIHAATGQLLRDLVLDPSRDYQPTGQPPGPPKRT
jgi:hypothetical protein